MKTGDRTAVADKRTHNIWMNVSCRILLSDYVVMWEGINVNFSSLLSLTFICHSCESSLFPSLWLSFSHVCHKWVYNVHSIQTAADHWHDMSFRCFHCCKNTDLYKGCVFKMMKSEQENRAIAHNMDSSFVFQIEQFFEILFDITKYLQRH